MSDFGIACSDERRLWSSLPQDRPRRRTFVPSDLDRQDNQVVVPRTHLPERQPLDNRNPFAEEYLMCPRRACTELLGGDVVYPNELHAGVREAITTLNSRARKLEALRAEAAGLADRFSLPVPILTMVSEPQYDVASLSRKAAR